MNWKDFICTFMFIKFLRFLLKILKNFYDFLFCGVCNDSYFANLPHIFHPFLSTLLPFCYISSVIWLFYSSCIDKNKTNWFRNYIIVFFSIDWASMIQSELFNCVTDCKLKFCIIGPYLLKHWWEFNSFCFWVLFQNYMVQKILDHFCF